MKTLFFWLFHLLFFLNVVAQPEIIWEKNYGGSGSDGASEIINTEDGNMVILGGSNSNDGDVGDNNGGNDYWILKLNTDGEILWKKVIGDEKENLPQTIIETNDKGFIILGASYPTNGYVITKLDDMGKFIWEKKYGTDYSSIRGYDIVETKQGDLVVVGSSQNIDYLVVKFDADGAILWEKTFGGSSFDIAYAVTTTKDEGIAIAGYTKSNDGDVGGNNGDSDYWVIKLDGDGELVWERNFGHTNLDVARVITETADGELIVGGYSIYIDDLLIKLDADGNTIWEKILRDSTFGSVFSIVEDYKKRLVLVGSTRDPIQGTHPSYVINQLDENGNFVGGRIYGGTRIDNALSVVQTLDGNFVTVGGANSNNGDVGANYGQSDYWVVKLGGCFEPINKAISQDTIPTGIYLAQELIDAIGGVTKNQEVFFKSGQAIILKSGFTVERGASSLAEITSCEASGPQDLLSVSTIIEKRDYPPKQIINETNQGLKLSLSPNPTSGVVLIDFRLPREGKNARLYITDTRGRIVFEWSTTRISYNTQNSIIYNTYSLEKGIYFVNLKTSTESQFSKLLIL